MQTVIPKIISDLLSNPGIGFIAAPHLMGDPADLRDNRGTPVENTASRKAQKHGTTRIPACITAEGGGRNWSPNRVNTVGTSWITASKKPVRWVVLPLCASRPMRYARKRMCPYGCGKDGPKNRIIHSGAWTPTRRITRNAGLNLFARSRHVLTGMNVFPLWTLPLQARGARAAARSLWSRKS